MSLYDYPLELIQEILFSVASIKYINLVNILCTNSIFLSSITNIKQLQYLSCMLISKYGIIYILPNGYNFCMYEIHNKIISFNGYYVNNRKEGKWMFHDVLNNYITCTYKNNRRHGINIEYYRNIISCIGICNNDSRDAYWKHYYNGNISSKGSYKDGIKIGLWKIYRSNGRIHLRGFYIDNHRRGLWKNWNNDGKLMPDINYH